MKKLLNILLYGGIGKEMYAKTRLAVSDDNKKNIRLVTIIGVIGFALAAAISDKGNVNIPESGYYLVSGILLAIFLINEFLSKKYPIVSDFLVFIYAEAVLIMGVLMAYSQYTERTTLLLPFFSYVAMVFCYRPIYLIPLELGTEIFYLLLMKTVEEGSLYFVNMVNTSLFCITGIIGGALLLVSKYKKFAAEYNNRILIEYDTLTGTYNRFSWQKAIDEINEKKKSVIICSFDVNGLKECNDTKGHAAGDELIVGAAKCLQEVFGPYGDIYRTGGDEFCALLYKPFDEQELRQKLVDTTKAWEGSLCHSLNIACGMAKMDHNQETRIEDVIHKADMQMYDEKRLYYQKHNRRK